MIVYECSLCSFTSATLPQWFSQLHLFHCDDPEFGHQGVVSGIDGCSKRYYRFTFLVSHACHHHKSRLQEAYSSGPSNSCPPVSFDQIIPPGNTANALIDDSETTAMETEANAVSSANADAI